MKRVLHDFIAFHEMEAQAARALLSQTQKALQACRCDGGSARGRQGQTQVLGDRCLPAEESTWEQTMERGIEETEARLQQRWCEDDGVLEALVVGPGAWVSAPRVHE